MHNDSEGGEEDRQYGGTNESGNPDVRDTIKLTVVSVLAWASANNGGFPILRTSEINNH